MPRRRERKEPYQPVSSQSDTRGTSGDITLTERLKVPGRPARSATIRVRGSKHEGKSLVKRFLAWLKRVQKRGR